MHGIKWQRRLSAVCVIVRPDGKILMGQRLSKKSRFHKKWQLPGGGNKVGEPFIATATREALEETNLSVQNIKFLTCYDKFDDALKIHYLFLVFIGIVEESALSHYKNNEPRKCKRWDWFHLNDLPSPLILEFNQEMLNKILDYHESFFSVL